MWLDLYGRASQAWYAVATDGLGLGKRHLTPGPVGFMDCLPINLLLSMRLHVTQTRLGELLAGNPALEPLADQAAQLGAGRLGMCRASCC
jgi:hypothetical protein